MAQFTLDQIRSAADAKYGSTDIDFGTGTVSLRNPLRLAKSERDALMATQDKLDAEGGDQAETLAESIRIVASNKKDADAFLKAVGGDLAVLAEVFTAYNKGTQVGEA